MIRRRTLLTSASALLTLAAWRPAASSTPATPATPATPKTFVIVHGAWGGSWDWRTVADRLSAQGHTVFRVSLTGLGERAHLASPDIGLSTHIRDVVNVLLYENLHDVILLGHSYGGMVITGVADLLPERIAQLIYLDAFLPEDGETAMSLLPPARAPQVRSWIRGDYLVPPWIQPGAPPPGDVPQPLRTFLEPIHLRNPQRERIPARYILTVERGAEHDDFERFALRAQTRHWRSDRLIADHNPQRSAPYELCALLVDSA